jgi:hypothetical protein
MATKHNSIVLNNARDDEPIFVLRAQDSLAADLVRQWASTAERAGCGMEKVAEARAVADAMDRWPTRKLPD